MIDPITLIQLIAAIAQMAQMGAQGVNALGDLFPEFDRFWEEFEKLLRDDERVSMVDLDAEFYNDPKFRALVIPFIGGDAEAKSAMAARFREVVGEEHLEVATAAAEQAANEAASDDRKAELASRRFIYDAVETARQSLSQQIKDVGEAVADVDHKVTEGFADVEAKLDDLSDTKIAEIVDPKFDALHERLGEFVEGLTEGREGGLQVEQADLKEALREQFEDVRQAVVTEVTEHVVVGVRTVFEEYFGPSGPSRSALDLTTSESVEEHLAKLREDDPAGAAYVDQLLQDGPQAIVRAIRTSKIERTSLAVLVAAGRIAGTEGAYAEAEQAYLWAAELAESDTQKARQFVRAASAANAQDEEERFRAHLAEARKRDDSLTSLALVEARASDDSEYMLKRVEGVVPSSDDERALVHQTRAQAYLALGNEARASLELQKARDANPDNISVREFEAILPWFSAQLEISRGTRPDPAPLTNAAERFLELADEVAELGRANEAVQVRVRAAEALMLAGDAEQAHAVLEDLQEPTFLSHRARLAVARSAMVCQRADLVLKYAPESGDSESRLVRAEAQAIGGDREARVQALPVLKELQADLDESIRQQASFALLAASAADLEIPWDDEAAAAVAEVRPETEAAMRAERLATEGDLEEAEAVLLPYAQRVQVLRRLRDYAAMQEDWQKVEDRSRALIRLDRDPFDRMALADALRRSGRTNEATTELRNLTGNADLEDEIREVAFGTLMEIVGGDRRYERIRDLAHEWRTALPQSTNATWNLAFALARLSQHSEAYELFKEQDPSTLNEQRATLLAEIMLRGASPLEALQGIIDLSDRFERSVEALEAMTINASLRAEQEGVAIPPELRKRIRDTYATFQDRFPGSKAIRAIPAPETAEEFQELVKELQGDGPRLQREAMEAIRDGRAAVNLLAAVSNGGVGEAWGRLFALPIGFAVEEIERLERETAAAAIGGGVIWDSSSIFVVGALPEAAQAAIRTALPGSLIATETLEDADRDGLFGRGAAETFLDEEGNVGIREIADAEREEESRRVRDALELARSFSVEAAHGEGGHEELARLYEEGSDGAVELQAIVASALLATRAGRPLFSDDRWVREAARSLNIPTFGTLALVDALEARSMLTADERREARLGLAARGAWGVGLTREELITAGRATQFGLNATLAGAFHDRAAWRGRPAEMWQEIDAFLAVVFDERPGVFPDWIYRALDASAQALPQMPKSWFVEVMLVMAWGEGPDAPVLSKECFHALVKEAKSLPIYLSTLGHDPVVGGVAQFMTFVADQPEEIRFAYFTRLLRKLPAMDQYRVFMTFVRSPPN